MSPGKDRLFEETHIRHLWPALEALPRSVNDGSSRGSGDSACVPEGTQGAKLQAVSPPLEVLLTGGVSGPSPWLSQIYLF